MKEFKVGDISITQVTEWEGTFPSPESLLNGYQEAIFEKHLGWLSPDYYDKVTNELKLVVQCWLLTVGDRKILFDTGSGNGKNRPNIPVFHMLNQPFLAELEKAGAKPNDIDTVVCSHLHIDHVGWNTALEDHRWVPAFPNARYVFPKVDFDFWNPANAYKTSKQVGGLVNAGVFEDSVEPVARKGWLISSTAQRKLAMGLNWYLRQVTLLVRCG